MTSIASGERQVLAELRPAMIENGSIVAAGLLADGAGQPALADAGWADQGQIVVGVDPFPLRKFLEQGAVEATGGAIVDVFDARLLAQFGGAQAGGQAFVPPHEPLTSGSLRSGRRLGPGRKLWHIPGDEVLLGRRHERKDAPGHRHDLACPVSGSIHDNAARLPFVVRARAVRQLRERRTPVNRASLLEIARALCSPRPGTADLLDNLGASKRQKYSAELYRHLADRRRLQRPSVMPPATTTSMPEPSALTPHTAGATCRAAARSVERRKLQPDNLASILLWGCQRGDLIRPTAVHRKFPEVSPSARVSPSKLPT